MTKRKIIRIDEEKCNGCGLCVPNCAEGALKIVDGKARLVSDLLCDGLGACLGHCPQGAITIEEREAAPFDMKEAKKDHSHGLSVCPGSKVMSLPRHCEGAKHPKQSPCGEASHSKKGDCFVGLRPPRNDASQLSNWPVQIKLVPTNAPYFKGADLLIAADCVPFAYPEFHEKLLKDKVLLVGCPKLDDIGLYREKISEIVKSSEIRSVTYAHMEVPCCSGLVAIIKEAISDSGKKIKFNEVVISIKGERLK